MTSQKNIMNPKSKLSETSSDNNNLKKTLNMIIKIGLLIGLIVWCILILWPFVMLVIWGLVLAISAYPMFKWLCNHLGNRKMLASILVTLMILLLIVVPFILMASTFIEGINFVRSLAEGNKLSLAPPSESVKSWPLIGEKLYDKWYFASHNIETVINDHMPQIKDLLIWLVTAIKNISVDFIKFIISIIISGIFLFYSEKGGKFARELLTRLAGSRGNDLSDLAEKTIRNVTRGILGVAFIQATLAGIGFIVAGVPGAGLWALIALFLGIIQVGIVPVCLVVVIYMFFNATTLTAVLLLVWCIIIGPIDNILKPILLGRGIKSPMLVIFLGAIGGFLLSGLIGLFMGAVVLSIGYNFFSDWLKDSNDNLT